MEAEDAFVLGLPPFLATLGALGSVVPLLDRFPWLERRCIYFVKRSIYPLKGCLRRLQRFRDFLGAVHFLVS